MNSIPQNAPQGKPHYTYVLKYPDGRVFYVGKGIGDRIDEHEREAKRGKKSHKCSVIRKIWANGGEIVKTKVAYFESHKEALEYETSLIFLMKGYGHLTNLTDGGEGVNGYNHTDEAKQKIGDAFRGKPLPEKLKNNLREKMKGHDVSEETRRKIGLAGKGKEPWIKGKMHSEETRQLLSEKGKGRIPHNKGKPGRPHTEEEKRLMSESMKGRKRTEEHQRKLNEAMRGRKVSEQARRNMTEANRRIAEKKRGQPGHPHSAETRRKIGEAGKGRTPPNKGKPAPIQSEETRRKLSEAQKSLAATEARRKLHESHKGRKRPEGTGQRISEAKKKSGYTHSQETIRKIQETKQKNREAKVTSSHTFLPTIYIQGRLFQ